MLNYVLDLVASIYAALTSLALALASIAPIAPWHASVMLSAILAALAGFSAWVAVRVFRKH